MNNRDFPAFLLYSFGFLLLWEWLRPIGQLTDTSHIGVFIGFLILALGLSFLKMKWMWQAVINVLYIFIAINRLHYRESLFHFSWLGTFFTNVFHNAGLLADRDWDHLSNEFRTFLLFILLSLMVYLLHYWLLRRQRIFLFFFLTLIYITVLDTFTPYSAKAAIVRTLIAGFAVMGMLTFYRMIRKEKLISSPAMMRKWMVPLSGMIVFSVLVGAIAPKAAPLWPDPVPYFKTAAQKGNESGQGSLGPKRVGYGSNDDRLGGPFIGDNNPVFLYDAPQKIYWKVETKDVYTGKGWTPSGATSTTFREGDLVPVYPIPDSVEKQRKFAQVAFSKGFDSPSFLMYPAGIQRILRIEPQSAQSYMLEMDTKKEKITSAAKILLTYVVEYEMPKYKWSELQKITSFPDTMNPEFYKNYTQLPKGLPPRIKQLTEKITAGKTSWYDKAKAVESYFNSPDYTYDQKNVAVPGKNDDYVDQFLFETKRGYCDNFSTSMAVMLRTIGIPTRWVKGYTGGEFYKSSNGKTSQELYRVTNNNAHSWVEVFLPNVGWVPFEPTKGYSNDLMINYDTSGTPAYAQQTAPAPQKKLQQPQQTEEDTGNTKTKTKQKPIALKEIWNKAATFLAAYWKRSVLVLILMATVAGILYRIRGKWFPYLLLLRYRFRKKDETIIFAYLNLLKQLERFGIKRKESQTLRNYANYVDTFFSTREMTRLTKCYEQYLYQRNLPDGSWKEARELWENLIKKTIA